MSQSKTSKIESWIQPRRLLCLKKIFWNTPYTKGLLVFLRILPRLPRLPNLPKLPKPPKLPKSPKLPKLPKPPRLPKPTKLPNLPILTLAVFGVVSFCSCPLRIVPIVLIRRGTIPRQPQPQPQGNETWQPLSETRNQPSATTQKKASDSCERLSAKTRRAQAGAQERPLETWPKSTEARVGLSASSEKCHRRTWVMRPSMSRLPPTSLSESAPRTSGPRQHSVTLRKSRFLAPPLRSSCTEMLLLSLLRSSTDAMSASKQAMEASTVASMESGSRVSVSRTEKTNVITRLGTTQCMSTEAWQPSELQNSQSLRAPNRSECSLY